jgi:hypothetical protein
MKRLECSVLFTDMAWLPALQSDETVMNFKQHTKHANEETVAMHL